jgi:hypothetical protein
MSFMKKVAKVAAPFASLIPGVGSIIGAGLGLVGGLGGKGSKSANGKGQLDAQYTKLLGDANSRAGQTFDMGKPLVEQGAGAMQDPLNFYKNILAGGDKSSLALRGPIFDITKGYEQAQKNTLAFAPSGSSASAYADNARMKASQIARLKSDSLFNAAGGMAGVGSSLLSGGSNLVSGGNAATGNVLSAMLGGQNIQLQREQLSNQRWGSFGQGIGALLGTLLMPGGVLNGGKNRNGGSGSGGGGVLHGGSIGVGGKG